MSRNAALEALRELADWSLPRWEPDNPQTEGEQMRLYAMAAVERLSAACPCSCHPTWPDLACRECVGRDEHI